MQSESSCPSEKKNGGELRVRVREREERHFKMGTERRAAKISIKR